MPKRTLTEAQKEAMAAGRRRSNAIKKAKKEGVEPPVMPLPAPEEPSEAVRAVQAAERARVTGDGSLAEAMTLLSQAIANAQKSNNQDLVNALEESQRRLTRPENPSPPLISAYNPDGDRDHPRPILRAKVMQCGFPVEPSACTVDELSLLNQFIAMLQECRDNREQLPVFRITKADGSESRVTLEVKWNESTGAPDEVKINYPVKTNDMRSGLYSFNHMLREMLGLAQPQVDVPTLIARVRALEAENQALKRAHG